MLRLSFVNENLKAPKILCLGAHCDDIEIGCGGTILRLIEEVPDAQFRWVVLSGDEKRKKEAVESANIFLEKVKIKTITVEDFKESYFPFVGIEIKDYFERLGQEFSPDIIFTHYKSDAHQDHRFISLLTWNTFRNNLILEYEIPKYDGDLGNPNLYVDLNKRHLEKKIGHILNLFCSQRQKQWFDEETFKSILRIRGIEINSPTRYAEAFYCRKILF